MSRPLSHDVTIWRQNIFIPTFNSSSNHTCSGWYITTCVQCLLTFSPTGAWFHYCWWCLQQERGRDSWVYWWCWNLHLEQRYQDTIISNHRSAYQNSHDLHGHCSVLIMVTHLVWVTLSDLSQTCPPPGKGRDESLEMPMDLKVYRCYYKDCINPNPQPLPSNPTILQKPDTVSAPS